MKNKYKWNKKEIFKTYLGNIWLWKHNRKTL